MDDGLAGGVDAGGAGDLCDGRDVPDGDVAALEVRGQGAGVHASGVDLRAVAVDVSPVGGVHPVTLPVAGVDGAAFNDHGPAEDGIGAVGGGGLMADDLRIHQGHMAGLLVGQHRRAEAVLAAQLVPEVLGSHLAPAVDLRVFEIDGAAVPGINGGGTRLMGGGKNRRVVPPVGDRIANGGIGGERSHAGLYLRLRRGGCGHVLEGVHRDSSLSLVDDSTLAQNPFESKQFPGKQHKENIPMK